MLVLRMWVPCDKSPTRIWNLTFHLKKGLNIKINKKQGDIIYNIS